MLNRLLVLMYMCLTNQANQAHQKAGEGEQAVEGRAEGKDVLLDGERVLHSVGENQDKEVQLKLMLVLWKQKQTLRGDKLHMISNHR